MHVTKYG